MLSEERLSAIRAKVNRANSSQNKKSATLSSVSINGDRITERKKKVLRLRIVLLFAARLKIMKR